MRGLYACLCLSHVLILLMWASFSSLFLSHPPFLSSFLFLLVQSVANRTGSEDKNPHFSKVMSDLHHMKGKQENIASILSDVRE